LVNQKKKDNIKFCVYVGAMSALAVALAFLVHFPVFPSVPFLEYDPADIVIYLTTCIFGIPAGLIVTVIVSVLQGLTVSAGSGIIGILMHIFGTGSFVLVFGFMMKKTENKMKPAVSKVMSTATAGVATTVVMTGWNLVVTPVFLGGSINDVLAILIFIILFNIIKHCVNGAIAAVISEPISRMVKKI